MPDIFLQLPAADRREALSVAATKSGRPIHLLEKDIWVVWTLDVLFGAPFANKLVFKRVALRFPRLTASSGGSPKIVCHEARRK